MTIKELNIQDRTQGRKSAIDALEWMLDLLNECEIGKRPTDGNVIKIKAKLRQLERAVIDLL